MLAWALSSSAWALVAWIALVPLGLAVRDKRTWPELYLGFYVAGLVFQLVHSDWVRSGTGAEWLSAPRATEWLAQATGLALIWPLAFFVARRFISRAHLPMTVALPVVWVAFELARKQLWAIIDATGYPFGQLGLSQAGHPWLIQIADVGGVYAVSALVAAVNGLIVDVTCWIPALRRREEARAPIWAFVGVVLTLLTVLTYGAWRLSQAPRRTGPIVCLIPERSASDLSGTSRAEPTEAGPSEPLTDGQPPRPDLLIWSEGVLGELLAGKNRDETLSHSEDAPDKQSSRKITVNQLESYARSTQSTLIVGCDRKRDHSESLPCNSAVVIDPTRGYLGAYDKARLVPFLEFYPPGRPRFGDARRYRYTHGNSYPIFTIRAGQPAQDFAAAISICYDTCFPELYWQFMRPGPGERVPQFFVVPACESHDRKLRLQDMLLRLAQFRAVECRRAFVRNAQGGYSGIIDGNGTLIAEPAKINFDAPVILGAMPIDDRFSLYAQLGDWLPMGACAAVILLPLYHTFRERYRRRLRRETST